MEQLKEGLKINGLTCHYSSNKHTHVGTQRASPEQAQVAVGSPGEEIKEIQG